MERVAGEQNARPARFPTSTRPKNVTEPLEHPPDDLRRENVRNLPPIVRAMGPRADPSLRRDFHGDANRRRGSRQAPSRP